MNPIAGSGFTRASATRAAGRAVLGLGLTLAGVRLLFAGAAQPTSQPPRPPQSSSAVTFTLRLAEGRTRFRPGEIIPIELEFDSRVAKRFVVDGATYDRGGRLTIDEFLVEPADAVTDPLLDYFAFAGGTLGGLRTVGVLGEKPFTVRLQLNEWFRFERAGRYTLTVRSRRVSDESKGTSPGQSVVPVESNPVAFEILPRDPEWEATAFADALEILDAKGSEIDRRDRCRILRFLGTDAAVDEMIKRFDDGRWGCDFEYHVGLFGAPDHERVVRRLEAGLRASDQPVTENYLRTLALLSVYVQHPELRSPQTRDTQGRVIRSSESGRLQDLVEAAKATYGAVLDAALPEKTARARAMIVSSRLEAPRAADPIASTQPTTSRDRQREQLATTFLELSTEQQSTLLQFRWSSLAGPAMVPALRALVEAPAPALASQALIDLALRRLYELAPQEGRAPILRQIRNPGRFASLKTLGMLPDRELPELDDVLVAGIESRDLDALSIRAELLQRYASPRVAVRVLSQVDDLLPQMACRPQAALLAYFVRADAQLGRTLLDRVLTSRGTTGCYRFVLRDVAILRMTPGVEAAAVDHLDDPDPQVVISALETLRRWGSPASAPRLRTEFERWHDVWAGRQEELRYSRVEDRPSARQGMVEMGFLQALGLGQAWLADKRDLRELRGLCVTDGCQTQADHMIGAADDIKITIVRVDNPDDSLVLLAQYQLTSIAALEQKLSQYPKGTSFALDVSALEPHLAPGIVVDLLKFAGAQGITIRR